MPRIEGISIKAIVECDEKFLFVKRSEKSSHAPLKWECPGGKLEYGECPLDTLKREVSEETGIKLQVCDLFYSINHKFENEKEKQIIILFYYSKVDFNKVNIKLSHEHLDYKWVLYDDLQSCISNSPIPELDNEDFYKALTKLRKNKC